MPTLNLDCLSEASFNQFDSTKISFPASLQLGKIPTGAGTMPVPDVYTIYVDSINGNDTTGDGTQTYPFATIQKAHTKITVSTTYKIIITGTFDLGLEFAFHGNTGINGYIMYYGDGINTIFKGSRFYTFSSTTSIRFYGITFDMVGYDDYSSVNNNSFTFSGVSGTTNVTYFYNCLFKNQFSSGTNKYLNSNTGNGTLFLNCTFSSGNWTSLYQTGTTPNTSSSAFQSDLIFTPKYHIDKEDYWVLDDSTLNHGIYSNNYNYQWHFVYQDQGYVTTKSSYANVCGISTIETIPTSTQIRYLISDDSNVTWKIWDGTQWTVVDVSNIHNQGMDKVTLESITKEQWGLLNSVSFAIGLKTTDNTVTPQLNNLYIKTIHNGKIESVALGLDVSFRNSYFKNPVFLGDVEIKDWNLITLSGNYFSYTPNAINGITVNPSIETTTNSNAIFNGTTIKELIAGVIQYLFKLEGVLINPSIETTTNSVMVFEGRVLSKDFVLGLDLSARQAYFYDIVVGEIICQNLDVINIDPLKANIDISLVEGIKLKPIALGKDPNLELNGFTIFNAKEIITEQIIKKYDPRISPQNWIPSWNEKQK